MRLVEINRLEGMSLEFVEMAREVSSLATPESLNGVSFWCQTAMKQSRHLPMKETYHIYNNGE
jgi:hypothetical protein